MPPSAVHDSLLVKKLPLKTCSFVLLAFFTVGSQNHPAYLFVPLMDAVEAEVELSTALVRLVGVVPTTTPSDCTLRALPLTTKLTSLQLRAGSLVATADESSTEAARRKYFVVAIMIQCSSWLSTFWKLGRNGFLYLCAEDGSASSLVNRRDFLSMPCSRFDRRYCPCRQGSAEKSQNVASPDITLIDLG